MKVKELMVILKKCDPELDVFVDNYGSERYAQIFGVDAPLFDNSTKAIGTKINVGENDLDDYMCIFDSDEIRKNEIYLLSNGAPRATKAVIARGDDIVQGDSGWAVYYPYSGSSGFYKKCFKIGD